VGAEEERRSAAARLELAIHVPHRRSDRRAGIVFVDRQAEVAQVADDDVRDRALLTGWAP
jgi:hypothetical protein